MARTFAHSASCAVWHKYFWASDRPAVRGQVARSAVHHTLISLRILSRNLKDVSGRLTAAKDGRPSATPLIKDVVRTAGRPAVTAFARDGSREQHRRSCYACRHVTPR